MTEATRIHYLTAAVARAHWRVVRVALKRDFGAVGRTPMNIEDGQDFWVENGAFGASEEKVKKNKIGPCVGGNATLQLLWDNTSRVAPETPTTLRDHGAGAYPSALPASLIGGELEHATRCNSNPS